MNWIIGKSKKGDKCAKGSQLRPHVVWFGEPVPKMLEAIELAQEADIFLIVGTSLEVYPAASLVSYVPDHAEIYVVDPNIPSSKLHHRAKHLVQPATKGVENLKKNPFETLIIVML